MVFTKSLRIRWRRLVPWLVAVLLIGLFGTFVMSRSVMVNHRLAEAMAAAARQNPYWQLDDVMAHREKVPDAENSALVLAKVDELLPKYWPKATAPGAGGSTTGKTAVSDACDRVAELSANIRLDDKTAGVLRTELKTHEKALAIARTVSGYPRGRHEVVLSPDLINTQLSETEAVRRIARMLVADAAVRAEDGDLDGALESCRAILGTARSIGDEPMLISFLVRMAIDAQAMTSARRVLGQGEPSDAALAQLEAVILDEKVQPLLSTAMSGERATLFELIRRVEDGKVRFSTLVTGTGERWIANLAGDFGSQRPLALEWMNEAVAITMRPTFEQNALSAAWDAKIAAHYRGILKRLTSPLPHLLTPAITGAIRVSLRSQSELGSMAILIAAERQRRRTGIWPASIEEIDPSILPKVPEDPFSGKPFHFEHRDGQLFVYSIGPNGTDEHGEYDQRQWQKGEADDVGAKAWDLNLRRQPPVQPKSPDRSQIEPE